MSTDLTTSDLVSTTITTADTASVNLNHQHSIGTWTAPPNLTYYPSPPGHSCAFCGTWVASHYSHWCSGMQSSNWWSVYKPFDTPSPHPVISFGGRVASYKDLPAQADVGIGFHVEDIDTLVVREATGWFSFDRSSAHCPELDPSDLDDNDPVVTLRVSSDAAAKLLPAPKGVTNWPPSD